MTTTNSTTEAGVSDAEIARVMEQLAMQRTTVSYMLVRNALEAFAQSRQPSAQGGERAQVPFGKVIVDGDNQHFEPNLDHPEIKNGIYPVMLCYWSSEMLYKLEQVAAELDTPINAPKAGSLVGDAERYQWLRNNSAAQWEHPLVCTQQRTEHGMRYVGPLTGKSLDNAVDAAIRAGRKG